MMQVLGGWGVVFHAEETTNAKVLSKVVPTMLKGEQWGSVSKDGEGRPLLSCRDIKSMTKVLDFILSVMEICQKVLEHQIDMT